jgi:hypothetical protein
VTARWTRSADGVHRTDIRVMHRLSENDLVNVLAASDCDEAEPLSREQLWAAIRRCLLGQGERWYYWREEMDEAEVVARQAWAQEQVHRLTGRPVGGGGAPIPNMPGYVVGRCGHRLAASEWLAGFRNCERCE